MINGKKIDLPIEDMDKECVELCEKLNSLDGIETRSSCCGHLKERYMLFFFCNDFVRLGKLFRCVNRNYSDGKWEILVDGSDIYPSYLFWLRSKKQFRSYKAMEKSIKSLIDNIDWWEQEKFDNYFKTNPTEK